MENELLEKMKKHDAKLDAVLMSVEKTRKYFLVVTWVTIILIVVPLIGLAFAIPAFLNSYLGALKGF